MHTYLRIARPVSRLRRRVTMGERGLGLITGEQFEDHNGFWGMMLAYPNSAYHLESIFCHARSVAPAPTPDALRVLYFP